LERDQPLGAVGACLGAARPLLELGDLPVPRIRRRRHRSALLRRRPELAGVALPPPRGQVRRVQPLTPQQRGHGPFLVRAGIGLAQDPDLLGDREPAPGRLRRHLGRLRHHVHHRGFLDRPRH